MRITPEYGKYPFQASIKEQRFVSGFSTNDIYYGLGRHEQLSRDSQAGDTPPAGAPVPMQRDIIDALRAVSNPLGANTNNVLNPPPRQIHFLEAPSRKAAWSPPGL